jgi:transcriptional regulator with XRE-family HTH domain
MTNPPAPRDHALVHFGTEVRAARVRAGKRQGEFASEVDISRKHLANVEFGRPCVSDAIYWRIANALDLDASEVVREQVAS